MRVLTYNVHSCRGTDGKLSPERIGEVIAASGADVACIQELDVGRKRTDLVHQVEAIAKPLAMHFHFLPAIRIAEEEYGDAILSRFPMSVIRKGELPRPSKLVEPRGALWVEIEAEGTRWQVLNTHLGLGRGERRKQARALAEWIDAALLKSPVVFCGDLNSRTGSLVHTLLGAGLQEAQLAANGVQERTFSTGFPWICLDYIYVSPDVRVVSSAVLTDPLARVASDHFPLIAELHRHELSQGAI